MTEPLPTNENPTLCASCGGACCRTQPGIDHPDRFLAAADPTELLAGLLRHHAWVLALHPWRDEISGVWMALYYPRPATINEQHAGTLLATSDSGFTMRHSS